MVGTIVPAGRGQTGEFAMLLLYVFGSLIGGLTLGLFLTSAGAFVQHRAHLPLSYGLLGVFFLIASTREVEIASFRLPQSNWQVPRTWLRGFGDYFAAFAFGSILGAAFFTPVVSISFYAMVVWIVLAAGKSMGMSLALVYTLGRISPVVFFWAMSTRAGGRSISLVREVEGHRSLVFVLNGMLLAALAAFVLVKVWKP